jgi:hypothetical protein
MVCLKSVGFILSGLRHEFSFQIGSGNKLTKNNLLCVFTFGTEYVLITGLGGFGKGVSICLLPLCNFLSDSVKVRAPRGTVVERLLCEASDTDFFTDVGFCTCYQHFGGTCCLCLHDRSLLRNLLPQAQSCISHKTVRLKMLADNTDVTIFSNVYLEAA